MKRLIVEFVMPFGLIFLGFGAAVSSTIAPASGQAAMSGDIITGAVLVVAAFLLTLRGQPI